ncbi:MAG: hypothetical protein RLY86_870 [Pseudomonadota bacterium]|jgi:mono/diheme cytochrome c family protein
MFPMVIPNRALSKADLTKVHTGILAVTLVLTATAPGWAEPAGDPMAGAQKVQTLCSSCHAVGDGALTANDGAPTLPSVAAGRTDPELELWLSDPHGAMPPVNLTRQEIADIVAYIATLRMEGNSPSAR